MTDPVWRLSKRKAIVLQGKKGTGEKGFTHIKGGKRDVFLTFKDGRLREVARGEILPYPWAERRTAI
jgi:hypothetical protein